MSSGITGIAKYNGLLVLVVSISWVCLVGGETCSYLDEFQNVRYKTCYTGCCGDVHISYCCIIEYFEAIVLGSVVGFFLLAVFIALVVFFCIARRRRISAPDTEILIPDPGDRPNYGSTITAGDSDNRQDIEAPVVIDITPPSPTQTEGILSENTEALDVVEELPEEEIAVDELSEVVDTEIVVDDTGSIDDSEITVEEPNTVVHQEELVDESVPLVDTGVIDEEPDLLINTGSETILGEAVAETVDSIASVEPEETDVDTPIVDETVDTTVDDTGSFDFGPDINTDLSIEFSLLTNGPASGVITTDLDAEDSDILDTTVTTDPQQTATDTGETEVDETLIEEDEEEIEPEN